MGRRVAKPSMADEPAKPKSDVTPNLTDRAQAAKAEREERLRAALRNNLRRRNPTERKISERPGLKGDMAGTHKEDQDKDG